MTDAAFCENCGTDRDQYGSPDRRLFHRCASCRLEVCPDCWNRGRDLCLNCAPFSVGLVGSGRAAATGASPAVPPPVPAAATGWSLMAPDDSPGTLAPVAPAAPGMASLPGLAGSSRVSLGDTLSAARDRGAAGLSALVAGLGKPVRIATHAVLLLCLTTLGLLVSWQLVSFAGTALPTPSPTGAALGAGPIASPATSASPADGISPQPIAASTPAGNPGGNDRGGQGGSGSDGPHGGAGPTPRVSPRPTATAGGSPTDGPSATPAPTDTPAPTPTDTPTAAPTDTPPPPPTDTPEPPPTDTPGP